MASQVSARTQSVADSELDATELEHVIGFTGQIHNSLHAHPQNGDLIVYPVGCVIALSDLSDPHRQEVLRGHDEEVTTVVLSPSGRFIASGQKASLHRRSEQVLVWDVEGKRVIYHLFGVSGNVSTLAFSDDDRFLAGLGDVGDVIIIWDMQTGQPAQSIKCKDKVASTLCWGATPRVDDNRKSQLARYLLVSCHSTIVRAHTLEYDVRSMQYVINTANLRFPSAGLQRVYHTVTKSLAHPEELLCGTSAGELVVLNTVNLVYRASLPISTNGVHSIVQCNGHVFSGSGDGTIKRLTGHDQFWSVSGEVTIAGRVTSMTPLPDDRHVVAGTSSGRMFRVNTDDLSVETINENPAASVTCVAFGSRSDIFASLGSDGAVRVWDLSDYTVIVRAAGHAPGSSLLFTDEDELLCGFCDGSIRAFSAINGDALWQLPTAHRGKVNSIAVSEQLLFSGGDDGTVRAWNRRTRQFVAQFAEHTKPVTSVVVDCKNPKLLHSCGLDRNVITYDLQAERRCNFHLVREGGLCSMTQRLDSEQELVTAGSDGLILFWDCDESQAVAAIDVGHNLRLNCITISPSGRFLAVACEDSGVRVWDVVANELVAVGHGHSARVTSVAWSPDERQYISVAEDCTIAVFNFYLGADQPR